MKKRRRKKKNITFPLIVTVLVISLFMTLAYAVLNQRLLIIGNIKVNSLKLEASAYINKKLDNASINNVHGFNKLNENIYFFEGDAAKNYFKVPGDNLLWRIITVDESSIKIIREADTKLRSSWSYEPGNWEESTALVSLNSWYNKILQASSLAIKQDANFVIAMADEASAFNYINSYIYKSRISLIETKDLELTYKNNKTWILSNSFYTSTSVDEYRAFIIDSNSKIRAVNKAEQHILRPIIIIEDSLTMSGEGSIEDPFKL